MMTTRPRTLSIGVPVSLERSQARRCVLYGGVKRESEVLQRNFHLKRYVLNVERIANWTADKEGGFSYLGLSDGRKAFFATLKEGDVIVTYVKGTGFVDVREIATPGVLKLGIKGHYPEGAWPWQVRTRLVACAGIENAIRPTSLSNTRLCSGQWRYRFQRSGTPIDDNDGRIIAESIRNAAKRGSDAAAPLPDKPKGRAAR
jgi:hypothetical protein